MNKPLLAALRALLVATIIVFASIPLVLAACDDGVKDGSETDVDCGGGVCPACADGRGCLANGDCSSGLCSMGICQTVLTCPAGFGNCDGDPGNGCETPLNTLTNCGGCGNVCDQATSIGASCNGVTCSYAACMPGFADCNSAAPDADGCETSLTTPANCGMCGLACGQGAACVSGQCVCPMGSVNCGNVCANLASDPGNCGMCGLACTQGSACVSGMCQAATTCIDGFKDGSETDVDCGGGICPPCAIGKTCTVAGDCQSQFCSQGFCFASDFACADSVLDGFETDVDCGGGACPTCANGRRCVINGDCQSQSCVMGLCQSAPSCSDGIQNGNETGVDCGGSCPPCAGGICIGSAFGDPGQPVTVEIPLDNGEDVAGFQIDVGFDPSLLNFIAVHPGASTDVASGWSINSALIGFGRLRVLGESNPPTGLGPGPWQVARIDFGIVDTASLGLVSPLSLSGCVLSDSQGVQIPCDLCPQPGRVTVRIASSFSFRPINSPLGVNVFDPLPFPVTVEALSSTGDLATGYDGTAAMSVGPLCAGFLQPASLPFSFGVAGRSFTLACCFDDLLPATILPPLSLRATDMSNGISGDSNPVIGVAKGNVNADDSVNVLDVLRAVNFSLGLPVSGPPGAPPISFQRWAANMLDQNCMVDTNLNVLDIVRIRNMALGRPLLCSCLAAGAASMSRRAPSVTTAVTPLSISLEKEGPKEFVVRVKGAVDLSGLQLELIGAGQKARVSLEGLTAGKNWQASTSLIQGVLKFAAFSNSATGISGDGVVLRITGGGHPRITSVVAADSEGREIPTH
jgi:cohesin domain-containing protein